MRTCLRCGKTDFVTEFYKSTFGRCRECHRAIARRSYQKNREGISEKRKAYWPSFYKKNKVSINRATAKWQKANPAKTAARAAKWRKKHPEKVRAYNAKWRKANPHKERARQAVKRAIKKGVLTRPDKCEKCGKRGKIDGHHPNYSCKLEVVWLCHACHEQLHHYFVVSS